jgi:DNA polymerase-1
MRHLLIDADVLAYKAATAVEVACEWEPGHWTWHADEMEARAAFDAEVEFIMNKLSGDRATLALTDGRNFRKAILPTYKSNRAGNKKPLVLKAIRKWIIEERAGKMKDGLEGDDVLGIMATQSAARTEERIIVSIDKDFKTVPGLFCRDLENVVEITVAEADTWHMVQTLTGDPTDGYIGCRGVGAVKAKRILDTSLHMWDDVVATFEKYGFTAGDALIQARVARILRASDYDFKRKEPILWSPQM